MRYEGDGEIDSLDEDEDDLNEIVIPDDDETHERVIEQWVDQEEPEDLTHDDAIVISDQEEEDQDQEEELEIIEFTEEEMLFLEESKQARMIREEHSYSARYF